MEVGAVLAVFSSGVACLLTTIGKFSKVKTLVKKTLKSYVKNQFKNPQSVNTRREAFASKLTYQTCVYVIYGNHVGVIHSGDAILVCFSWGVLLIHNPRINMNFVGLH